MKNQMLVVLLRIPCARGPFFVDSFKSLCLCHMTVFLWCVFDWILLSLSYLEFIKLLGCADYCLSSNLGHFEPSFIQIFFQSISISLIFLGLLSWICWYACWFPTGLWASVQFSLFFLFFRLNNLKWPVFKFADSFFYLLKSDGDPLK